MKRYCIFGFLFMCLSTVCWAQPEQTTPTWGVRLGPDFSRVIDDDAMEEYAKKLYPAVGAFGNFYFSEAFSIQMELNYKPWGGKFKSHDLTMNLNYLQLPVFARYAFFDDPKVFLFCGPYGAYLLSAKTKGIYKDLEREESVNEDISDRIANLDYGICMGVGAQGRYNQRIDIFAEFRYYWGMRNIVEAPGEERYNLSLRMRYPFAYGEPRNKSFGINVGIIVYLYPR